VASHSVQQHHREKLPDGRTEVSAGPGVSRPPSQFPDARHPLEPQVLHHFLTNTCFTLALRADPAKCRVWPVLMPQVAEASLCVRQSLIAISAIHLCRLGHPESKKLYQLACEYAVGSSVRFRESVANISRMNCLEVIAFSVNTAIFGFTVSLSPGRPESVLPFNPMETLRVMRSFGGLIENLDKVVSERDVDSMFYLEDKFQDPLQQDVLDKTLTDLDELEARIRETSLDKTARHAPTYSAAVIALRKWAIVVSGRPWLWKQFIIWPAMAPSEYLGLLEEGYPTAVEIFVHWCNIMKRAPSRWYLLPWLEKSIAEVQGSVETVT